MRKQRNMSQTKEQDKPGKVLTETQIRNLPDKEFKVKRLTELEKQNKLRKDLKKEKI